MKLAFLAALALPLTAGADAQTQQHFFPKRPPNVTLHSETGVLADYGIVNDTGGFTIAVAGKKHEFIVGYPLKIDGVAYRCLPRPSRMRGDGECKPWPREVIVGKSRVRVEYWWQTEPGVGLVRASDTITVARHS